MPNRVRQDSSGSPKAITASVASGLTRHDLEFLQARLEPTPHNFVATLAIISKHVSHVVVASKLGISRGTLLRWTQGNGVPKHSYERDTLMRMLRRFLVDKLASLDDDFSREMERLGDVEQALAASKKVVPPPTSPSGEMPTSLVNLFGGRRSGW